MDRNQRTPRQIAELKKNSRCKTCGALGHWHSDLYPNGKLKLWVKTSKSSTTTVPKGHRTPHSQYAAQKKSLTFNMVNIADNSKLSFNRFIGLLLDDVAPYSGLGMHELKILSPHLRTSWNGVLDPLPSAIRNRTHWQYCIGTHSSDSRKMLDSVMICAKLNDGHSSYRD